MELRYCERCGDVIKSDSDAPITLKDSFICSQCEGGDAGSEPNGLQRRAAPAQMTLTDLELFSQDSIAIRKQELDARESSREEARPQPSKLRLVKSGGSSVVKTPKSPAPQQDGGEPATAAEGGDSPGRNAGSSHPAGNAQKIVFRCLFCKSPISIRPVATTSKLQCPSCKKPLYVTADGRLEGKNPSVAIRKKKAATRSAPVAQPQSQGLAQKKVASSQGREAAADSAAGSTQESEGGDATGFLGDEDTLAFGELNVAGSTERRVGGVDLPAVDELVGEKKRRGAARASSAVVPPALDAAAIGDRDDDEEDWPSEGNLLGDDEFDSFVKKNTANGGAGKRKTPKSAVVIAACMLVPVLFVFVFWVGGVSALEVNAKGEDAAPMARLERFGDVVHRGVRRLCGHGDAATEGAASDERAASPPKVAEPEAPKRTSKPAPGGRW